MKILIPARPGSILSAATAAAAVAVLAVAGLSRAQQPATSQKPANTPAKPGAKPGSKKSEEVARALREKADEQDAEAMREAARQLKEISRNHELSTKELERLDPRTAKAEDLEKAARNLQEKVSPEAREALRKATEPMKQEVRDAATKAIEEQKQKRANPGAGGEKPRTGSSPATPVPPVTFEKIPPPPVYNPTIRRKEMVESFSIRSGILLYPPQSDPARPGKPLPPDSKLARTYRASKGVVVLTDTMHLTCDELDMLAAPGNAGVGGFASAGTATGQGNAATPAASKKTPAAQSPDPVSPGAGAAADGNEVPPFEWAEARGRARVRVLASNGAIQEGMGGRMEFDQKKNIIKLTDWPVFTIDNRHLPGHENDPIKQVTGNSRSSQIIMKTDGSEPETHDCRTASIQPKQLSQAQPSPGSGTPAPAAGPAATPPARNRPRPPAASQP